MSPKKKTLSLRITFDLDKQLKVAASEMGVSKNALIATVLNDAVKKKFKSKQPA
ncbi:toxin-antitoxin system HicB family antitoxin [Brevibacillus laterosporus]|uniref:toxin-antitoxin system HicB family antitoxin n=1 Tax=Brevibacillus laterosporus TaxID=1465 RepID=UPI003D21F179